MSLFRSTGNSAEDKMSDAAGCSILAVLGVAAFVIVGIVLLVRWLA